MNQREKIMAVLLAVLLAGWVGKALYGSYQSAVAQRESALNSAQQQLASANLVLANGRDAMRRISQWQEQSLPIDRNVAQSLYRSWLSKTAKEAGLRVDDINPNERTTPSTAFQSIGFSLETKGTLEALTRFLYAFYRSALLQQITKLNVVATAGAPELTISLQVEALILPGATHDGGLPDGQSNRLKLASVDEYTKAIVGRNIFKVYTPPRPAPTVTALRTPPRPPAPEFDEASQTYVTGILGPPANLQAWITIRTTGEVLRVRAGDDVKVGDVQGKVESISPLAVVIKIDEDQQLRIKLGQSLREALDAKPKEDAAGGPGGAPSDT